MLKIAVILLTSEAECSSDLGFYATELNRPTKLLIDKIGSAETRRCRETWSVCNYSINMYIQLSSGCCHRTFRESA